MGPLSLSMSFSGSTNSTIVRRPAPGGSSADSAEGENGGGEARPVVTGGAAGGGAKAMYGNDISTCRAVAMAAAAAWSVASSRPREVGLGAAWTGLGPSSGSDKKRDTPGGSFSTVIVVMTTLSARTYDTAKGQ